MSVLFHTGTTRRRWKLSIGRRGFSEQTVYNIEKVTGVPVLPLSGGQFRATTTDILLPTENPVLLLPRQTVFTTITSTTGPGPPTNEWMNRTDHPSSFFHASAKKTALRGWEETPARTHARRTKRSPSKHQRAQSNDHRLLADGQKASIYASKITLGGDRTHDLGFIRPTL